jgi:hypothetical protein
VGSDESSLRSILLISLRTSHSLLFGSLVPNFGPAQLANVGFYGVPVDKICKDSLGFLKNARAAECTLNQRAGFQRIDSEYLFRISLDFFGGNFKDRLGYLRLVILTDGKVSDLTREVICESKCLTLSTNFAQTWLRISSNPPFFLNFSASAS